MFCRRCLGVGAAGYNQPAQDANLKHRKTTPAAAIVLWHSGVSSSGYMYYRPGSCGRWPNLDIYKSRVANFIATYIHIFVGLVPMGDGHTQVHRPGSFGRWPHNNNNNNNIYIFIIIQESINIYLNPALVTQAAARVRPED